MGQILMLLIRTTIQHSSIAFGQVFNEKLWKQCVRDAMNGFVLSFLGYDKVANLLIEKGADVNIVGKDGITALILAAKKGKK